MTFSEQEVHDIVDMVISGIDIEIAKEKIIASYKSKSENKTTLIAKAVMKHFNIESLEPKSRRTPDIMPMQVYSFLLNDLIKGYLPKEVRKKFTEITKRDRLTLYHYTKMHEAQAHMVDYRYAHGDTFTNHFLSIKEKITGEKLSEYRIQALAHDEDKGLTTIQIRFRDNKEDILKDIESITSYHELNKKYFHYESISNLKTMFNKTYPEFIGKIRYGNKLKVSRFINENKESFIKRIEMGYSFKRINKEFKIYSRSTDFKRSMLRHEPILSKMILKNEA